MFTEISMTNFKSWRETGPVRMAPLTAFFGANSSGKSSLLQMLLLLKQTAESNDRGLVLKTGSMQPGYVNLGTPQEITFGDEKEMSLGVSWKLDPSSKMRVPIPGEERTLGITNLAFATTIRAEQQRLYVKSLSYRQAEAFSVKLDRKDNNRYIIRARVVGKEARRPSHRPRVLMTAEKCYGFSDEALLYYQNTGYLRSLEHEFERQFRKLHYLGPLREYPQRTYVWGGERPSNLGLKGEQAVHALLSGKSQSIYRGARGKYSKLDARVAKWLVDLDLSASFETRPLFEGSNQYAVWLKRHEKSSETLLSDVGIGVSQVLPVLVLCYYVPVGSTIILEQPELHLHPSVQAGLADVFIDVIQKRDVQIIVESHSEHFLRRLQRRIAEEKLNPCDTALYFCEMCVGESVLTPLEIDLFGDIRNWPEDFFGDMTGEILRIVKLGFERKVALADDS
ncbi:MAG: DUF3696 domain-containing protein [Chloroflexi bacterium]|nr:DUF3696 domain-containing protein [Chloroflexota bacterium]MCY4246188.1 DUF3696 domain-containing protein [Chloroflexota bacterium]